MRSNNAQVRLCVFLILLLGYDFDGDGFDFDEFDGSFGDGEVGDGFGDGFDGRLSSSDLRKRSESFHLVRSDGVGPVGSEDRGLSGMLGSDKVRSNSARVDKGSDFFDRRFDSRDSGRALESLDLVGMNPEGPVVISRLRLSGAKAEIEFEHAHVWDWFPSEAVDEPEGTGTGTEDGERSFVNDNYQASSQ